MAEKLDETPAEEFSRLVIEYNEGERQHRAEAWNLIADFALEHCDAILRGLSASPSQVAPANPAQVTDARYDSVALEAAREIMTLTRSGVFDDRLKAKIQVRITEAITAAIGAGGQAVAVKSSLAEELAERHKRQMLDTEHEAFQAAQAGDKARQSIASTESERHRAVYHAMRLILEDQRKLEDAIPRAANAGRYLAEVNDGRLLYLNHANTWQECPNFLSALSQPHPADERVVEALWKLNTPPSPVQKLGAAISRRDWHEAEQAHASIRDALDSFATEGRKNG